MILGKFMYRLSIRVRITMDFLRNTDIVTASVEAFLDALGKIS
jgi:hypothetical protein